MQRREAAREEREQKAGELQAGSSVQPRAREVEGPQVTEGHSAATYWLLEILQAQREGRLCGLLQALTHYLLYAFWAALTHLLFTATL